MYELKSKGFSKSLKVNNSEYLEKHSTSQKLQLKSWALTIEMEKTPQNTTVCEAFNNYDGSRDKTLDILTSLKVNVEPSRSKEAYQS